MIPKLTTRYSSKANKFYGYKFNGKIYKTKFMPISAMKAWLKKHPKKNETPIAKPVYIMKKTK